MDHQRKPAYPIWIDVVASIILIGIAAAFFLMWPDDIGPLHIFGIVAGVLVAVRTLYQVFIRSRAG